MSKAKTPQQKKRLSYKLDRRNTYGENQKSSRKNIPKSKQRSHQDERCSVRQALVVAEGQFADEIADEAQSQVIRKGRLKKLKAFRKSPDRPLGEVIERRLRRRRSEKPPNSFCLAVWTLSRWFCGHLRVLGRAAGTC